MKGEIFQNHKERTQCESSLFMTLLQHNVVIGQFRNKPLRAIFNISFEVSLVGLNYWRLLPSRIQLERFRTQCQGPRRAGRTNPQPTLRSYPQQFNNLVMGQSDCISAPPPTTLKTTTQSAHHSVLTE